LGGPLEQSVFLCEVDNFLTGHSGGRSCSGYFLNSLIFIQIAVVSRKTLNHQGHEGARRKRCELSLIRAFAHPMRVCAFADLELARVLLGPAFDDNFLFRIELNRVAALAVHDAEKAVFPSAEWEICHRRCDPNVDADIS